MEIRQEKRKRSLNKRNSKTPAFGFRLDGTQFENGVFRHDSHVIFLPEFPFKHKSKMTGDCWVFKFLRRRVDVA